MTESEPVGFGNPWKSEANPARTDASVEPLGNVSDEWLSAVYSKLAAICFMWRLGLSAEEQQKPEAAAVLIGMFDAIKQDAGFTAAQFTICFRATLQAATEAGLSPLAVPLDDLLRRMIATPWDAKLLPWSFYATHKIAEMQTKRLDVCATIGGVLDAVKSGKFEDPAAHIAAKAGRPAVDGPAPAPVRPRDQRAPLPVGPSGAPVRGAREARDPRAEPICRSGVVREWLRV
jgi:hypothetical protein